jgi:hypothetical protein
MLEAKTNTAKAHEGERRKVAAGRRFWERRV